MYYDMSRQMEQAAQENATALLDPLTLLAEANARTFSQGECTTIAYATLTIALARLVHVEGKMINGAHSAEATKRLLKRLCAAINTERRRIHEQSTGALN